jgi:hypothetical protein
VFHYHALTLSGFLRQHFNYGRGAHCFHEKRAARYGRRVEIEPPRFYIDLVFFPLRSTEIEHRLRTCVLMLVSQVANAAGFFREKLRRRRSPRSPDEDGRE